MDKNIFNP